MQDVDRPQAARNVAKQYLRRERTASGLLTVLVVSVFLGTYLATSLVPAILVGAGLVVVTRAPLVQPRGNVRLRTDEQSEAVVESFTGPTPPVLVFQWGIADEITAEDGAVTYRLTYLFGLRSVEVTVDTRTVRVPSGERQVELEVTVGGQPWSTYVATVETKDSKTIVEYEYTTNRRFGLRRLPQRYVATRYRDEALRAQGYVVVGRDEQYSIAA